MACGAVNNCQAVVVNRIKQDKYKYNTTISLPYFILYSGKLLQEVRQLVSLSRPIVTECMNDGLDRLENNTIPALLVCNPVKLKLKEHFDNAMDGSEGWS